jgi:7-cyano-7-deazaguanine synthase
VRSRFAKPQGVVERKVISFDLRSWGGSALTDDKIDLPVERSLSQMGENIPVTYVPCPQYRYF